MSQLTAEQLGLVMSLPREDWGWGFEIMLECVKNYKPERGALKNYYGRAVKLRRHDIERRENRTRITKCGTRVEKRIKVFTCGEFHNSAARAPVEVDLPELSPNMEPVNLYARGLNLRQIADVLSKPIGTIKSTINRQRRQLSASFPEAARCSSGYYPSRGGIYRGSDSERTAMSGGKL